MISFKLSECAERSLQRNVLDMDVLPFAGIHLTGMYMNPVNASNQTFGCAGISVWEHIFVYWGGPLLASALAVIVQRRLSEIVKSNLKSIAIEKDDIVHKNGTGRNFSVETLSNISRDNSASRSKTKPSRKGKRTNEFTARCVNSDENAPKSGQVRHRTIQYT